MVSRRDKNLMSCARTSVSSSVDCPDSAVLSYEAQTPPHSTHLRDSAGRVSPPAKKS